MLGRRPRQVARLSSPSARLTSREKPRSEISAPGLLTVLWITSSLPRSTSTSVTASLSDLREEIASRCAWLLMRASSISASSSSLADCDSTGPATSISSSKASVRMVRGGAVSMGARRLDNSARAALLDGDVEQAGLRAVGRVGPLLAAGRTGPEVGRHPLLVGVDLGRDLAVGGDLAP